MIPLTLAEAAGLTGGRLADGDPTATVRGPVVLDSRDAAPGSLFVAVAGDNVDGHDYAQAAVSAGATAVLASRPVGVAAVVVDDVREALGRLARGVLGRIDPRVVGVTGSSGKTSAKDLLAQLLEPAGPTVATRGSFNNELGLPLTVLEADERTRHLVLEMGAKGVGHIAALCRTAPPGIGVVLNVGSAHAGEFGGREATARAKGELVEALPDADSGGVAVLNADDPLVAAMAGRTAARVVRFGVREAADVRALDVRLDDAGRARFTLGTPDGSAQVRLRLHGAHHVENALAAAAAAMACGLGVEVVAEGLSAAVPRSRWRMEVTERPDGVTVVNDAYNANPESMRAALGALVAMAGSRRSWAVLGEMLELGAASPDEHAGLGRLAVERGVDRLVVVGEGARDIARGAAGAGRPEGEECRVVPDAEAAHELLAGELRDGDVVLFKSSRDAGLRWLGERVAAGGRPDDRGDRP